MVEGLNELLELVKIFCGDVCSSILKILLKDSSEFIDEELASKLGANINDIRRALYELQTLGIITYRRERDKSGNFVYYWYADVEHLNQLFLRRKKTVLRRLEDRLKLEEENSFYVCPQDDIRLSFDEALENEFRCPRCNMPLEFAENEEIKRKLRELILSLQEEVFNEERALGR